MQLARVIGDVVATLKDANLSGITLLVLQPIDGVGRADAGRDAGGARFGRCGRRRGASSSSAAVRPRSRSIPASRRPTRRWSGSWTSGTCRNCGATDCSGPDHADRQVVGTVVATQKNQKLEGAKLLLVQPMTLDRPAARRRRAGDRFGRRRRRRAGAAGHRGEGCRRRAGKKAAAVDAAIIGIVDEVDYRDEP